jgi:hypothetical protein
MPPSVAAQPGVPVPAAPLAPTVGDKGNTGCPTPPPISSLTNMRHPLWCYLVGKSGYIREHPAAAVALLHGILHGVAIGYTGTEVARGCDNLRSATEPGAVAKLTANIADGVLTGKMAGPFDGVPVTPYGLFSASPIGAVPKKNSVKLRTIHHLSFPYGGDSVNSRIFETEKLAYGTVDDACDLIQLCGRGCLLTKLDVKSAFRQVPVRLQDQGKLGFHWQGKYYYERCLPFGLRSAPRLWEQYATALHYFLQKLLHIRHIVHYVDDFLFVHRNRSQSSAHDLAVAELHKTQAEWFSGTMCGLALEPDKTEGPTTCLTFLGIELDTVSMTARLDAEKLAQLQQELSGWRVKVTPTGQLTSSLQNLEVLAGRLGFAAKVVRPGRIHLRYIYQGIAALKAAGTPRRKECLLVPGVSHDVLWWHSFIEKWNGISVMYEAEWRAAPKLNIFTDACNTGYGGLFGDKWIRGEWSSQVRKAAGFDDSAPVDQQRRSMPYLELYSLVLAASTFGHLWHGLRITFQCDCDPVVYGINKGGSPSNLIMVLIRYLSLLAARHQFEYRAEWIQGEKNVLADALSRNLLDVFRQQLPSAEVTGTPTVPLPSQLLEPITTQLPTSQ